MANIVSVRVKTDFPKSSAEWNVDVGDGDLHQQLAYTNLAYDLVALAMGKLGVAMSKEVCGDCAEMDKLKADAAARHG